MATEVRKPRQKMIFTKGREEVTVLSVVEQLISLFLEIDSNDDGSVSREELTAYYTKHGLDKSRVDEWMNRFDTDADGRITMQEFSKGLGLDIEELKLEKRQRAQQRSSNKTGINVEGIEVLNTTMAVEKQEEVVTKFKDLMRSIGENENRMAEVNDKLKDFLDQKYGRIWQCVTLTGSYWSKFCHEPFMSIQFKYQDKYIVLAWRTHRL
ncbi:unnamed protein product [Echinostoma caproni]|uniref:EF-hand domain-containing protein n=1 Tax=Echinostoma caproni TaxID=27848 RepID=A0A183AAS2_9TREM|nr:unnamed protein product [Echinostoma caproni]